MEYATLKLIHVSAVAVSFCGFAARGLGVLCGANWVRRRITRGLAHCIDTVLLFSALGMLWIMRSSLWAMPWLRAKIIGLILYIALGVVALRRAPVGSAARPQAMQLLAWVGSLLVFGYIVSVALTKSPRGALVWLDQ